MPVIIIVIIILIIIINPLTARVVGAPQIILQPIFSIFPCSPLPSGTWRTPGLSIPWCCLPTSSSVGLVFFPLSLCPARWFWSDLMNGKHDCTLQFASFYDRQKVFVWSNCLLDLGTDILVGNMVFVWDVYYLAVAPHFHGLYSSLELCCEGPWFTSIQEDGYDKGAQSTAEDYFRADQNLQWPNQFFLLCVKMQAFWNLNWMYNTLTYIIFTTKGHISSNTPIHEILKGNIS